MRIDWIRHGETPGNRERRYVGETDEDLTEEAVKLAGDRKAELEQPRLVVVSPLLRCRHTADLLYPGIPQYVSADLAECRFGRFEYRNYRELAGDPDYQAWIDSGGELPFPGGESRKAFADRCMEGFRESISAAERYQADHIAMVVHGGTIMAVLDRLSEPHRDYFEWQCGNLAGYSTEYDGENIRCLSPIMFNAEKK